MYFCDGKVIFVCILDVEFVQILIIVFTNTIISFLILLTIKFDRKDDGTYDDELYRS